jgi:hypothetical protein
VASPVVRTVITLLIGAAISACTGKSPAPAARIYTSLPERIDPACRDGQATLFDECSDQLALFEAGIARAKLEKKVVLVEFGAEWCIWCHVFETHVNGEHGRFEYTYGAADEPDVHYPASFKEGADTDAQIASSLRDFVAANFVIVHIDCQHAPNGAQVLERAGVERYPKGIPFVFSVDTSGHIVREFDHDAIEKRRDQGDDWYRGYDRLGLLKELTAMRDAVLANRPPP